MIAKNEKVKIKKYHPFPIIFVFSLHPFLIYLAHFLENQSPDPIFWKLYLPLPERGSPRFIGNNNKECPG